MGADAVATTELARLVAGVARHAPADGAHETATPDLTLYHTSAPTDLAAVVYVPSLCIVAQGSKEVVLAGGRATRVEAAEVRAKATEQAARLFARL